MTAPTELDSYDFMELVALARKAEIEGLAYTVEHYPPVFADPALVPLEDDYDSLRHLLRQHRDAIAAWWTHHPDDGCDLHNDHIDRSRQVAAERRMRKSTS